MCTAQLHQPKDMNRLCGYGSLRGGALLLLSVFVVLATGCAPTVARGGRGFFSSAPYGGRARVAAVERNARPVIERSAATLPSAGKIADAKSARATIQREGEGFKVSVQSQGKNIVDFHLPLVHRVALSRKEIDRVVGSPPPKLSEDRDSHGGVVGLRVVDDPVGISLIDYLGLERGDIITAFGKEKPERWSDFTKMLTALIERPPTDTNPTTLTLIRRGQPNKVLYYLGS